MTYRKPQREAIAELVTTASDLCVTLEDALDGWDELDKDEREELTYELASMLRELSGLGEDALKLAALADGDGAHD